MKPDEAMLRKRVDMWPAIGVSAARRKLYHLTEPWLSSTFALISRADTPAVTPSDVVGKDVVFNGFPLATQLAENTCPGRISARPDPAFSYSVTFASGKLMQGFDEASYLTAMLLNRPSGCNGVSLAVHLIRGAASSVAFGAQREFASIRGRAPR
jgi:hypothetical protein